MYGGASSESTGAGSSHVQPSENDRVGHGTFNLAVAALDTYAAAPTHPSID